MLPPLFDYPRFGHIQWSRSRFQGFSLMTDALSQSLESLVKMLMRMRMHCRGPNVRKVSPGSASLGLVVHVRAAPPLAVTSASRTGFPAVRRIRVRSYCRHMPFMRAWCAVTKRGAPRVGFLLQPPFSQCPPSFNLCVTPVESLSSNTTVTTKQQHHGEPS